MKKKIISFTLSVVMLFTAIPLLSGCSNGIGGSNINAELVKDLALEQSDIDYITKPFEIVSKVINELNSKNEVTNEDIEGYCEQIIDAFSPSKDTDSESEENENTSTPAQYLLNKAVAIGRDSEEYNKWGDELRCLALDQLNFSMISFNITMSKVSSFVSKMPIQYFNSTIELVNSFSEFLYNKEVISEEELNKIAVKNIKTSYKDNVIIASYAIVNSAIECEDICILTQKVWRNSIHQEHDSETDKFTTKDGYFFYDDFNDALNNLADDSTYKSDVDSVKEAQDTILEMMKYLKDTPEEFSDEYASLKELYSAYQSLSQLAVNPTGSYNSYSDSYTQADTEVGKCYDNMRLYID
ncbi:MAG: hypothetical protein ACI4JI_08365 [Ruminiclostridium sp.]